MRTDLRYQRTDRTMAVQNAFRRPVVPEVYITMRTDAGSWDWGGAAAHQRGATQIR